MKVWCIKGTMWNLVESSKPGREGNGPRLGSLHMVTLLTLSRQMESIRDLLQCWMTWKFWFLRKITVMAGWGWVRLRAGMSQKYEKAHWFNKHFVVFWGVGNSHIKHIHLQIPWFGEHLEFTEFSYIHYFIYHLKSSVK